MEKKVLMKKKTNRVLAMVIVFAMVFSTTMPAQLFAGDDELESSNVFFGDEFVTVDVDVSHELGQGDTDIDEGCSNNHDLGNVGSDDQNNNDEDGNNYEFGYNDEYGYSDEHGYNDENGYNDEFGYSDDYGYETEHGYYDEYDHKDEDDREYKYYEEQTSILVYATSWKCIQDAINTAVYGEKFDINVKGNIVTVDGYAITIPAGVTVNLRSYPQVRNFSIYQETVNQRHFIVDGGILNLHNVALTRTSVASSFISGGVLVNGGQLNMHDGSEISNNRAYGGGGVEVWDDGIFNNYGGIVKNNLEVNIKKNGNVYLAADEDLEEKETKPTINFGIYGPLIIEMSELHRYTDVTALLLRGITAIDENDNDVTYLITIADDGGFEAYVTENFSETLPGDDSAGNLITNRALSTIEFNFYNELDFGFPGGVITPEGYAFETVVTYEVIHPETGEKFTAERYVYVLFMGISALSPIGLVATDWEGIRNGINQFPGHEIHVHVQNNITAGAEIIIPAHTHVHFISNSTTNFQLVQWNNNQRHFIISNGGQVVLHNISLVGPVGVGPGMAGGVMVLAGGHLFMNGGSRIERNRADTGGGVWVLAGGHLTMNGGAIYGNRTDSIPGVTTAVNGGGVAVTGHNHGGGNIQRAALTMNGGTISGNYSSASGAGVWVINGDFNMNGGTISGNSASHGGGLLLWDNSRGYIRPGATIRDNRGAGGGGGAWVYPTATLTMTGGAIYNNWASSGGGLNVSGTFNMSGGTIHSNIADQDRNSANPRGSGGGVFVLRNGVFNMSNGAVIHSNRARYGGGVHVSNVLHTVAGGNPGVFTMGGATTTIRSNVAIAGGGGVSVVDTATFTMNNGIIGGTGTNRNTAGTDGGGVRITNDGVFIMNNGNIRGNNALEGGGVAVRLNARFTMNNGTIGGEGNYRNTATNDGGGVRVVNTATFDMVNGDIRNNSARDGGGVQGANDAHIIMRAGQIRENTATRNGGGVALMLTDAARARFDMTGGNITANNAVRGGGVDVADQSRFNMSGGTVGGTTDAMANRATGNGGGVHLANNARFIMSNATTNISRNRADGAGGGVIIANTAQFTMNNGIIQFNNNVSGSSPATNGGGVYITNDGVFIMNNGNISGNRAVYGGGVATNSNARFTMNNGTIGGVGNYRNTATNDGGGVRVSGGGATFDMINGDIRNNAARDGGGVQGANDAHIIMRAGQIRENTATRNGGGVALMLTDASRARFDMTGGNITANNAVRGGGVDVADQSRFNMSGGTIGGTTDAMANRATGNGGGVHLANNARFTMSNATTNISRNIADGAGGGVHIANTAQFTMNNGIIQFNNNVSGSSPATNGGGVALTDDGVLIMYNGYIRGNSAVEGGGVSLQSSAVFTMHNGNIRSNTAGHGAGVNAGNSSTFDMRNGTIGGANDYRNTATNDGGGVRVVNTATFDMVNGDIRNNTARDGGGIQGSNDAHIIMRAGQIRENTATGSGGGVSVVDTATFTMNNGIIGGTGTNRNTAGAYGGGVHITNDGVFIMYNGYIRGNSAVEGGGVSVVDTATFTMNNGIIGGTGTNRNTAGTYGGGVRVVDTATFDMINGDIRNNAARDGGGVAGANDAHIIMRAGQIRENIATLNGGGVSVVDTATFTMNNGIIGGIGTNRNTAGAYGGGVRVVNTATFDMVNGDIRNNAARDGGGIQGSNDAHIIMRAGQIRENTATYDGGGVRVVNTATFDMVNGDIRNNAARDGGGIQGANDAHIIMRAGQIRENTATRNGGGVALTLTDAASSRFDMTGGNITANTAIRGGGVDVADQSRFNMSGGTIGGATNALGNTATNNGGGVSVSGTAHFTMSNATTNISHNQSVVTGGGGVIVWNNAQFTMDNGIIQNNNLVSEAPLGGGVLVTGDAQFAMNNGYIRGNRALHGGGVHVMLDSEFTMNGGTIGGGAGDSNMATADGGGVFVRNTATMTLVDGRVENNIANKNGGGIVVQNSGQITMGNGYITENVATYGYGGGVFLEHTTAGFSATGGNITNNHAYLDGGGIWTADYEYEARLSVVSGSVVHYNNVQTSGVTFGGNTAENGSFAPPINHRLVTWISGTGFSPTTAAHRTHHLNNFDINFNFTPTGGGGSGGGGDNPPPQLGIEKSSDVPFGDFVSVGQTVTYTIMVRNIGNVGANNVTIVDTIPVGMTFVQGSAVTRVNNVVNTAISPTITNNGRTLTWTVPSIGINQTVTISFEVTVDTLPEGVYSRTFRNIATVNNQNTNEVVLETEKLIKLPDRMFVYIGEAINWTLRGFGNPTGETVTNFGIVDMPGVGLNFRSASLPVFTNGAGITYDIRYRIAGDATWHTAHTGVNANQPFTFSLPQNGTTYYTEIWFYFGTVPAGFATGNQEPIVITFIVGPGAPNNRLVNNWFLFYNYEEEEGYSPYEPIVLTPEDDENIRDTAETTINDGSVPLGEWRWDEDQMTWIYIPGVPLGGIPQTGVNSVNLWLALALFSVFGMLVLTKKPTRRRTR